jgi:hypothetical protein
MSLMNLNGVLPPAPGDERGEMLLHELVHSLQHVSGTLTNEPMHGTGFDTVSEFNAIVVTNVYSSERGRVLRSHHHGFTPAQNPGAVQTNPIFATRLNQFRQAQPALAQRLAAIRADWNPFYTGP